MWLRHANPIRQEGKKNQRRPDNCITEKYLKNHVKSHKKTKSSARKQTLRQRDSHLKIIKWNLFKNSSDNAQGFIKSFVGAETELKKHYATSSLKEQKPDVSER